MLFILGACGKEKKESVKQENSTKNIDVDNLIKEELFERWNETSQKRNYRANILL